MSRDIVRQVIRQIILESDDELESFAKSFENFGGSYDNIFEFIVKLESGVTSVSEILTLWAENAAVKIFGNSDPKICADQFIEFIGAYNKHKSKFRQSSFEILKNIKNTRLDYFLKVFLLNVHALRIDEDVQREIFEQVVKKNPRALHTFIKATLHKPEFLKVARQVYDEHEKGRTSVKKNITESTDDELLSFVQAPADFKQLVDELFQSDERNLYRNFQLMLYGILQQSSSDKQIAKKIIELTNVVYKYDTPLIPGGQYFAFEFSSAFNVILDSDDPVARKLNDNVLEMIIQKMPTKDAKHAWFWHNMELSPRFRLLKSEKTK